MAKTLRGQGLPGRPTYKLRPATAGF